MNKIWLIIKREYSVRVKKKSFIVMTFLGPILFGLFLFGALYVAVKDFEQYHVLVADTQGLITRQHAGHLESAWPKLFREEKDAQVIYEFTDRALAEEAFRQSPYNVQLTVDSLLVTAGRCEMLFKHKPSEMVEDEIETNLERSVEYYRALKVNIPDSTYDRISVNIDLVGYDIDRADKLDLSSQRAIFGFGFAAIIYIFIFVYGVQVMRGVIEEKTNRIVEVIISSVKPFQLMMGKVVGIGLVGLTQFLMWILLSTVISAVVFSSTADKAGSQATSYLMQNQQMMPTVQIPIPEEASGEDINVWRLAFEETHWSLLIGMFLFFFVGGYLLYGSLFAAIGAAVDNETDTQQFMLPITLPLIFSYVVAAMMMTNPESAVANFFSVFPLTSPILMMVKTAIGVHWWLILLSVVTLIATFIFMIWVAGRIYRVGILMYGKKPTYRELWKWVRYRG